MSGSHPINLVDNVYDILITGTMVFINEYELVKNGYVYIEDGEIKEIGEQPVPSEFQYASLIVGGQNRVIVPSFGIAWTDISLYDTPVVNRGGLEDRFKNLSETSTENIKQSIYKGLYDLSIKGVGIIGVEVPNYALSLELESASGLKIIAITERCVTDVKNCVEPYYLKDFGQSENNHTKLYINSNETLAFYNNLVFPPLIKRPGYQYCSIDPEGLIASTKAAYEIIGLRWRIEKSQPALISVYNFNEPPAYKLTDIIYDITDLLSICKDVETLIVGNNVVVDGGEHLTIGKKLMGP